jgi:hypothetical protein
MIERNRRTQIVPYDDSGPVYGPTRCAPRPGFERPRVGPQITLTLSALCGVVALIAGAWLATGCAQTKREPAARQQAQQPQSSRPRRALENSNAAPPGTTDGEKTGASNESKAERQRSSGSTGGASAPASFSAALEKALAGRGVRPEQVCDVTDAVSRRVLEEYGAMFVASSQVLPPPVCMFSGSAEVGRFQQEAKFRTETLSGTRIELQPAAMQALLDAREEARTLGLDITPRGGAEAARRGYDDTLRLWNSRFLPALTYWRGRGRLSAEQVEHLRRAALHEQVREVLELEKKGIFFSKDLSKSILYSVAAPGSSQHLSMLAFDASQFGDARVRRILARHGWFQTVKSDLPHFTYLGVEEKDLPALGLRRVEASGHVGWRPNGNRDEGRRDEG